MAQGKILKTEFGTELPLLDLHGKDYMPVPYRVIWFRGSHPDWSIETEVLRISDDYALMKAVIKNEQGRIIATGHQDCLKKDFLDFVAKAETSAIGRALGYAGFGTAQALEELSEGGRISDAPIVKQVPPVIHAPHPAFTEEEIEYAQSISSLSEQENNKPPTCEACGTELRLTKKRDAFNCPNWKDTGAGRHSYVKI
jgi:hypothetical protein